jgi:hypothetical protein
MIAVDGVWDIETENWDRFVCGGIVDSSGNFFRSYSEDAFARELISRKGTYWAHNGGGFDHLWLASWCAKRGVGWRGIPRGASIVAMYVGEVTLRDSLALWPDRLETVAKLGGLPKLTIGLPCKCGKECGGYCSISRKADAATRAIIDLYLERDCRGLIASLLRLVTLASHWGVTLRPTVGASAWATALEWCGGRLTKLERDVPTYKAIRAGYYGGRTQCFIPVTSQGHRHDINSAYPAALSRITLPIGEPQSRGASGAYDRGDAGIYTADVTIPDCHVPPLPLREEERLVYPVGRVTGTWTGDELRHAQSRGVTIHKLREGLHWSDREPVLKPFADRVWALRAWAKENDLAYYPWVKWLANSLTGKLAMKVEHETLYYSPEGEIPDSHHRVIGQVGDGVVYTISREQVGACAWVEHAAHLTAATRIELECQLIDAADDAVYCDTDAVYSRRQLTRAIGKELGEWAYEGSMRDWECLAPKLYRYTNQDGKVIVKGKGMSGLTSDGFDALKNGDSWFIDRGVVGAMRAIREGEPFRRKAMSRGHRGTMLTMGDRAIALGGITTPPRRNLW